MKARSEKPDAQRLLGISSRRMGDRSLSFYFPTGVRRPSPSCRCKHTHRSLLEVDRRRRRRSHIREQSSAPADRLTSPPARPLRPTLISYIGRKPQKKQKTKTRPSLERSHRPRFDRASCPASCWKRRAVVAFWEESRRIITKESLQSAGARLASWLSPKWHVRRGLRTRLNSYFQTKR